MKTYEIRYLNYEGNTPTMQVEVEDDQNEDDAQIKAIKEDCGYGDGIMQIIDCTQIS